MWWKKGLRGRYKTRGVFVSLQLKNKGPERGDGIKASGRIPGEERQPTLYAVVLQQKGIVTERKALQSSCC